MYHWATVELSTVLHVALIYKEGREGRDGRMDGRMWEGKNRNAQPAWGLFLVTGSGPSLLTPSVKLLRCSVRCGSDTETEECTDTNPLSLTVYDSLFFSAFPHIHLCTQTLCSKSKLFLTPSRSLCFPPYLLLLVGEICMCYCLQTRLLGRGWSAILQCSSVHAACFLIPVTCYLTALLQIQHKEM